MLTEPGLAYIGLGANLGDMAQTLRLALKALAATPQIRLLAVSGAYRSAPIESGGPDYLNAVACLQSTLAAEALLDRLLAIELEHGRLRPFVNAPRTLDLDLLLYGGEQISAPRLTLPHPRLHLRAFVLLPLLELDPTLVAPGLGGLASFLPSVAGQTLARTDLALYP
ncbi:2-amino-4-hydroxy-6-hydroxymethyldihydropteridine diphosphokinase [Roseateles oligotrophus]|uniref:2-amino-4-hydroxy-6-hydroxymethyldihydropteridine pyrophosphokinase n=1 Tax=Roseateles oligotrophus TaxID=1769250 RepID=A0ABT2YLY5_9BURK|nr:2-amino-4-hydroxy-6-hydroxymethyldihydropteridine diphosphokinase [Roseateles oligotrophus]MCV2370900.1 2-amino-4-hydroxy-6-hydroxymethyldihydropteridine diphosphokinase [Roseateles oligotrophus]